MKLKGMTHVGNVGVDSGQVMIVDPCYLDGYDPQTNEEWDLEKNKDKFSYQGICHKTLTEKVGQVGLAVASSSGYGDGYYPVYAEFDENERVVRLVIDFMGEDEEY
jgi:phosphodiesterase/alkaline phosphatase D-like protein